VFIDPADGAKIFDQLAVLFDRGLLTPPATKTWQLENSVEAYQRVQDGAAGIKQVLLPADGRAHGKSRISAAAASLPGTIRALRITPFRTPAASYSCRCMTRASALAMWPLLPNARDRAADSPRARLSTAGVSDDDTHQRALPAL